MNFDFPAFLVAAAALTGLIWAVDALLWAPRRRAAARAAGGLPDSAPAQSPPTTVKEPVIVEYSRSFFPVILVVLVLRSFIVEPFRIPSGSMMPTLLIGDFILVNKYAYGIRLPVLDKKIIAVGEPVRGDIVVFRFPQDPSVDYIKRVIGLPGDRIAYIDKTVYINGKPVPQQPLGLYNGVGQGVSSSGSLVRLERLDETPHRILLRASQMGMDNEYIVPSGQYFMMGDNRDNSNDSRYWGTVPEANLVGKAFMIWMNWDSSNGGVGWERIGNFIH